MTWLMKNADTLLRTVSPISLQEDETAVSASLGHEALCSYNWLKDGSAIFVPGGPPRWSPKELPVTLCRDKGYQYVDQNAFRVPKYPFEPAFRALSVMNGSLQLNDTDIVINRNSLRKLLDFAAGRRQDPFRVDLHMVKDTLFVSRREKNARQMIHGALNSGYGHSFETAFTIPQAGLDRSNSHHRVVRYKLGILDCVVRFEVDACYGDDRMPHSASAIKEDMEDLSAALANYSIDQCRSENKLEGRTKVVLKGSNVASTSLAELKAHKTVKLNKAIPQLWFGRTPYLITGKHVEGTVQSVSCENLGEKFEAWETANQIALRKLVNLLKELKQIVLKTQNQTAILVCQLKGAPLKIYSEKRKSDVLPPDIIDQYWR